MQIDKDIIKKMLWKPHKPNATVSWTKEFG